MRPALILALLPGLATLPVLACMSTTDAGFQSGTVSIVLNASTMGASAFAPNPLSVSFATGATVAWANRDITSMGYGGTTGTTHHLVSDTGLFDSGVLGPGKSFAFTFAASGTYTYHCSIHPTMVGTITLTP
jgi:plastocyanin